MSIATSNIGNTVGNIYVSGGNTAITWLTLNNYTANTVSANVHAVPAGNSANTQNLILTNVELTGFDTYQIYAAGEKLLLSNNDSIQAVANSTGNLNAVVSYTTI
jgi:hypothetical protein